MQIIKEATANEAAKNEAVEKRDKPKIDQIKAIWIRLNNALERSEMDFATLCDVMDISATYME